MPGLHCWCRPRAVLALCPKSLPLTLAKSSRLLVMGLRVEWPAWTWGWACSPLVQISETLRPVRSGATLMRPHDPRSGCSIIFSECATKQILDHHSQAYRPGTEGQVHLPLAFFPYSHWLRKIQTLLAMWVKPRPRGQAPEGARRPG